MIRLYASDPAYPDVSCVANQIAQLTNAHLFWDLRDMDELERRAALVTLKDEFEEMTH